MDKNYLQKYQKYKSKYLDLDNKIGGTEVNIITQEINELKQCLNKNLNSVNITFWIQELSSKIFNLTGFKIVGKTRGTQQQIISRLEEIDENYKETLAELYKDKGIKGIMINYNEMINLLTDKNIPVSLDNSGVLMDMDDEAKQNLSEALNSLSLADIIDLLKKFRKKTLVLTDDNLIFVLRKIKCAYAKITAQTIKAKILITDDINKLQYFNKLFSDLLVEFRDDIESERTIATNLIENIIKAIDNDNNSVILRMASNEELLS